jgi:hypothetical protein
MSELSLLPLSFANLPLHTNNRRTIPPSSQNETATALNHLPAAYPLHSTIIKTFRSPQLSTTATDVFFPILISTSIDSFQKTSSSLKFNGIVGWA